MRRRPSNRRRQSPGLPSEDAVWIRSIRHHPLFDASLEQRSVQDIDVRAITDVQVIGGRKPRRRSRLHENAKGERVEYVDVVLGKERNRSRGRWIAEQEGLGEDHSSLSEGSWCPPSDHVELRDDAVLLGEMRPARGEHRSSRG